ncbi:MULTISPECIES: capsule biosynthesis protein [Methylobacterium]|uniref:capsule biosynthesis protein n=1 Tax=Methylobacterium TaxID=407 RepID=UPI0010534514|nr:MULTISPECIES: capsule biosynthesis protein [Methylobacterium]MDR7036790.1 capsular polysaccharide transport system permease protein [Methylobacterium sp. BE186]
MNVDEVKQEERLRGIIDVAPRSVPELRRDAETIEPIPDRRLPALLRQAREKLDWTRVPGLRPRVRREENLLPLLIRRFSLFVLLPTAVVAVYLFVFASDQYVAEAQFAVRGNVEPMGDVNLGEFTSLIQKHNSQDSFIVRDFIHSQTMVELAEKEIGVSKMFSRSEADFWARFNPPQPIEELSRYWRRHVEAQIEAVSGVITLTARAFTPGDALAIAREVVAKSEGLINQISKRAQADMVAHAQQDATEAQERLKRAHLAIQQYRNRWGIIDPIKSAESTLITLTGLRKDKFKAENDLQVLRGSSLNENARGIQVLVAHIAAIDQQMKQLQDQLTSENSGTGGMPNMTQALLEYEGLLIERTIAEKLNESANTLLDRARVSAGKQQIYLATFVPPVLPTYSLYPQRGYGILIAFFCFLVVWSSVSLVAAGVKDQRL